MSSADSTWRHGKIFCYCIEFLETVEIGVKRKVETVAELFVLNILRLEQKLSPIRVVSWKNFFVLKNEILRELCYQITRKSTSFFFRNQS